MTSSIVRKSAQTLVRIVTRQKGIVRVTNAGTYNKLMSIRYPELTNPHPAPIESYNDNIRWFHTSPTPCKDIDTSKTGMVNNDKQQQQEEEQQQQPHGTAKISFAETDENETVHEQDDVPHHPVTSLKGGDPAAYTVPIVIKMPDMSEEDDKNNVLEKWYKQPGDVIKRNDVLCDITTPDFTFGMVTEDEDDAVMGEIHVDEGETAADNTPICTIYHLPEDHEAKEDT
ncbi:dienelactone hydrolase family protein [Nitzschia inconspicua]|uniref:Dienelactone hydrolase family protein n=1 Tax=Nitzschia inconspicua TaxID=303405 RepID=A0A9K3L9N4_9STRA|nr:dienelactone hydrolase family protein [Nitzschia inconspicua]